MAHHNKLGQLGEKLAAEYLVTKNYNILEKNWRFSRAEIDIIAMDEKVLVFIEVKARSSERHGKPEESVSDRKQALITDAATRYMESINHEWEIRFDVISLIIPNEETYTIDHYKDAFFAGW